MANRKPRTEAQKAALAAGRAAKREQQAQEAARKAGVNTTGGAGDEPGDMPASAPDITTTPYQKAPESPEQKAAREKQEPIEPFKDESGLTTDTPDTKTEPPAKRAGLLDFLRDGLLG